MLDTYSSAELAYLTGERRLARVATVGADGTPNVTPVGMWTVADDHTIEVTGHDFDKTKKFRDVASTGRAAIVVDDVLPPWQARGVQVRGRAETIDAPRPAIRIYPDRVISWGLDTGAGATSDQGATGGQG